MLFLHLFGMNLGDPGPSRWDKRKDDRLGRRLDAMRPKLLSYLVRRYDSLTREDVEDALVEAFIYVLKQVRAGAKIGNLGAYVRIVAVNKCIDFARVKKDHVSIDDCEQLHPASRDNVAGEASGSVWVGEVLSNLTDYERLIISLSVLDAYTLKEIGMFLADSERWRDKGKGEAQISRDVQKAKDKLKGIIENADNEPVSHSDARIPRRRSP